MGGMLRRLVCRIIGHKPKRAGPSIGLSLNGRPLKPPSCARCGYWEVGEDNLELKAFEDVYPVPEWLED